MDNTQDIAEGSKPLKNKQHEQLCLEYLIDYNKTQAGIRAGYSKKTAHSSAQRALEIVEVQARLTYLSQEKKNRARKSADDIIERLENIAFTDLTDFMTYDKKDKQWVLKPIDDIKPEHRAALESIAYTKDGRVKVKKAGAHGPLQLLGKEQGLFTDKLDISGDVTVIRKVFEAKEEPETP